MEEIAGEPLDRAQQKSRPATRLTTPGDATLNTVRDQQRTGRRLDSFCIFTQHICSLCKSGSCFATSSNITTPARCTCSRKSSASSGRQTGCRLRAAVMRSVSLREGVASREIAVLPETALQSGLRRWRSICQRRQRATLNSLRWFTVGSAIAAIDNSPNNNDLSIFIRQECRQYTRRSSVRYLT